MRDDVLGFFIGAIVSVAAYFLLRSLLKLTLLIDDKKLKVIHVEADGTVGELYSRYYSSANSLDVGDLAFVWHRPKTYQIGNGPVTLISKDRRGAYWVFGYGHEKYLDPSEPYREHSGDPRLTGFAVEETLKLPSISLIVHQTGD